MGFRNPDVQLIDVRSPSEFQEDHISGALNIPVLSDQERSHVGKLYTNGDILRARFEGASVICANLSRILLELGERYFPVTSCTSKSLSSPADSKIGNSASNVLVYCARGGQRSNSLATLLTQIGWPGEVGVLVGGFRSWRRLLLRQLDAWPLWMMPGQFWVVSGLTGSGKSLVLSELAYAEETVLDLEHIANHKGSIFGAEPTAQACDQRLFESRLHHLFVSDPKWQTSSHIWMECESRTVGPLCHLPAGLWTRLRETTAQAGTHRVWLDVPEEARVAWILETYEALTKDPDAVQSMLTKLAGYHSSQRLTEWRTWVNQGDFVSLVTALLRHHYDPVYRRGRKAVLADADRNGVLHRVSLPVVDRATIRSRLLPHLLELADVLGGQSSSKLTAS
ncbi:unnamed protein product [Dicrocoelium dendriticum]|nr:unnamed protein product [Dicrocoelium dendriticum]